MSEQNQIIPFDFESKEVRVLTDNGGTLICATDAAKALGYKEPHKAVKRHCRGGMKRPVIDSMGRTQDAVFIHEPDLYRMIAHSKLPSAEKFEAWIFEEVLPSIRKTGGYINPAATPEQLDTLITNLIDQVKHVAELEFQTKQLKQAFNRIRPKGTCGELSENTGLPKMKLIGSHWRSSSKDPSCNLPNQLLLPFETEV